MKRLERLQAQIRARKAGPKLTADDFYRHKRLREFGCRPYPMPFMRNRELVGFQRWTMRVDLMGVTWEEFKRSKFEPRNLGVALGVDTPLFNLGTT